jgi:hypothetical protein
MTPTQGTNPMSATTKSNLTTLSLASALTSVFVAHSAFGTPLPGDDSTIEWSGLNWQSMNSATPEVNADGLKLCRTAVEPGPPLIWASLATTTQSVSMYPDLENYDCDTMHDDYSGNWIFGVTNATGTIPHIEVSLRRGEAICGYETMIRVTDHLAQLEGLSWSVRVTLSNGTQSSFDLPDEWWNNEFGWGSRSGFGLSFENYGETEAISIGPRLEGDEMVLIDMHHDRANISLASPWNPDLVLWPVDRVEILASGADQADVDTLQNLYGGVNLGINSYCMGFDSIELASSEEPSSPEDLNGDGVVDGSDLGLLFAAWGECEGCPEDLNGDGQVDGSDLGLLFAAWGS